MLFALRRWPTWLLLGVGWIVAQLPYAVLLHIGRMSGTATYLFNRKRWRRASAELWRCFPDSSPEAHRRLLFANAQSYGMGMLEDLISWWRPAARLERLLNSVSGLEHLKEAQRAGRGVILLAVHTTTLDICTTLLRLQQDIDFVYRPAGNPVIEYTQRRGRIRHVRGQGRPSAETLAIPVDSSVHTMIQRLRAGRVVLYAPDRDFGKKPHVFAPLFGMPAATVTATSRYARLTGAAVLTINFWRDPQGGYGLRIGAPLDGVPSDSNLHDCTRINTWIESAVREYPEQYRWVHKRFRTRPPPVTDASNAVGRLEIHGARSGRSHRQTHRRSKAVRD